MNIAVLFLKFSVSIKSKIDFGGFVICHLILFSLWRVIDRNEKRHIRNNGKKLIGIRSLECNFNPKRLTYNPHFHLIVKDKETAEILMKEWVKLLTSKFVNRKGQDYEPVIGLERALVEIDQMN